MAKETINQADIYYDYMSNTNIYNGATSSNELSVYIIDGGVEIQKSSDVAFGSIGDTILYTLVISNNSTAEIFDVVVIDTIPNNLTFLPGSLTYNGVVFGSEDITLGVTLPNLNIGDVSTLTFSAEVVGDSESVAINVSHLDYNVVAGVNTIPVMLSSNAVAISIFNKDISFTKFQSTSEMEIGEVGIYSFIISNNGNLPIENLFITDTVPEGLAFVPGTLIVNGVATVGSPETGVFFSALNPNEGILISYQFTAESTPNGGIIKNIAQMDFEYKDYNGSTINDSMISNETTLTIREIEVFALQSTDRRDFMVGDIVEYTLNVGNLGTVEITDILAFTTVPIFSLAYVPNSLVIDGVSVPDQNIITGISIPDLLTNGFSTVNFSLQILNDDVKEIFNTFQIYYNTGSTVTTFSTVTALNTIPGFEYETDSNEWSIYILNPELTTTKTSNEAYIEEGDEVIYTIVLENTGSDILQNINFFDTLPNDLTFVEGFIEFGGISLPIGNPEQGVLIEGLQVNEVMTITIKAIS